jgi:hypothetical protein
MKLRRRVHNVLCAFLLASFVIGACSPGGESARSFQPEIPDLPAAPNIPRLSAEEPEAQAAELALRLAEAADEADRLAAWLAAYQAVGIPVISEGGDPITDTGDDPAGAPYWQVWSAAALDDPYRGLPLSDAGKILTLTPDWSYDDGAGSVLLEDIRAAVASDDPHLRLLGLFVRERIWRRAPGVDVLDPNVSADVAVIDFASLQLLSWAMWRGALSEIALSAPATSSLHLARLAEGRRLRPPAASARCASIVGDSEDLTSVVSWILGAYNNGIEIPLMGGPSFGAKGMIDRFMETAGLSEGRIGQIKKLQSRLSAVATVLSFLMQMRALDIELVDQGDPLERYRESREGKETYVQIRLFYDKKRAQGGSAWACAASFLSNALGVSFKLPEADSIAGAEVSIGPGHNIPDKVFIANSDNPSMTSNALRYTTGADGTIRVVFRGRARPKDLPDSASKYDDTFTFHVSAQPEAASGSSLVSMFVDSYVFWSTPSVAGVVAPLVDFLKTLSYDLGEMELLLIDWGFPAYQATGRVSGLFCLNTPSQLVGEGFVYYFNPSGANGGKSGSMSYNFGAELEAVTGGCSEAAVGDYTVTLTDDGAKGVVTFSAGGMLSCPGVGRGGVTSDNLSFDIIADPEASCHE